MPPEMTPDEEAFFSTGAVPPGLEAEAAASAAAIQEATKEPNPTEPQVEAKTEPVVDPTAALIERLISEQRTRDEAFEQRFADLTASLKPAAKVVVEPDEVEDPLGHMIHKLTGLNTQVAELKTELSTQQQNNLLKQQFEQFTSSVNDAKKTFEATTPDFKEAYAHIRTLRADDLRAAGAPEKDISKILMNDELQLAQTAIQRGKNPAAEMYAMAKRYGYAPKAATTTASQQTPEQKIEALLVGQRAARNPSKAATESVLTLDGLKDASSDDLNKLVQDDAAWNRIMGGKGKDIF